MYKRAGSQGTCPFSVLLTLSLTYRCSAKSLLRFFRVERFVKLTLSFPFLELLFARFRLAIRHDVRQKTLREFTQQIPRNPTFRFGAAEER